LTQYLPTFLG